MFAYIGLQFPRVLSDLGSESVGEILLLSGVVLLVVLVVRPLFIYPTSAWSNFQDRKRLERWDRGVESGEFEKLYKKWFMSPIPPRQRSLGLPISDRLRENLKTPTDQPAS